MKNYRLKLLLSAEIILSTPFVLRAEMPVKQQGRPNILFIVFDDASYQHFGANGCSWVKTPAFDRVAKEGLLFRNFYCNNAKSAPSRASMLTGLYSWQLAEAGNHIGFFPPNIKVFPEVLQENGYNIGYTGKPWGPGIAKTADGKERLLTGKGYHSKTKIAPTNAISREDYAANFNDFLKDVPDGKSWFFWCGGWEPHRPYQFKSGNEIGKKSLTDIDKIPSYLPDNDSVRTDFLDYAFELEYFDNQIAKLISNLESNGQLNNTLIVITSDNGMPFPRAKGYSFEDSYHIPLAMMWKNGIKKTGVVEKQLGVVNLAATFLDICKINVENSGMKPIAGKSITALFTNSAKRSSLSTDVVCFGRERNDFGRPDNGGYPTRSIMKGQFLYIVNLKNDRYPAGNPETGYLDCDGCPTKSVILNLKRSGKNTWYWNQSFGLRPAEELYDISKDKDCVQNLAENEGFNKIKKALRKELFAKLKADCDPRVTGNGDVFDSYPFMSPDYWNFWERVKNKEIIHPASKTPWVEATDYE